MKQNSSSSSDSKKIFSTKNANHIITETAAAYPYSSLWINGRDVALADILRGNETVPAANDFEQNTFDFIHAWLSGHTTFYLQTSGSTGTPKKISVTRHQMETSARMTAAALALQPGYSALVCLDTRYIAGKMMLVRCLTTGMRIVAITPSANPLQSLPPALTIDFTALVPYQVYAILESPEADRLGNLGHVLIGGAALDQRVLVSLAPLSTRFYATYGMTETISHIALRQLNGPGAASTFQALPGVLLSADTRDCLVIDAPHIPQSIVTNDIVKFTGPGVFHWLGRWDNVINSGGIKIIPEKIEEAVAAALNGLNITRSFIICGLPDPTLGHKVVLVTDGIEFTSHQRDAVIAKLRETLPGYEVPKDLLSVPALRYTETGKIHRQKTIEIVTKAH